MHAKTIVKPGYHLHPRYDLKNLRKHVKGDSKKTPVVELQLTSMIDMFTILVIFLLMNFSATGEIFFIQRNMVLPEASHGVPLESAPLITVMENGVILEAQKVGETPLTVQESDLNLPRLSAGLREIRKFEETLHPDRPFKGNVNIQADEKTPLIHIKRVMQTCILEGWTGINFAVRSGDGPAVRSPSQDNEE